MFQYLNTPKRWNYLNVLFLLLLSTSSLSLWAQMIPLSLEERTINAESIIIGRLVEKEPYWNQQKTQIFTLNTIEVVAWVKGSGSEHVGIITEGGNIGAISHLVTPSLEIQAGHDYVFFLEREDLRKQNMNVKSKRPDFKQVMAYGSMQGGLPLKQSEYRDVFGKSWTEGNLLERLQKLTQQVAHHPDHRPFSARAHEQGIKLKTSSRAITSVTPNPTNAGTTNPDDFVTITGSGFGSTPIMLSFPDAGKENDRVETIATDIVSWSDTQIVVKPPQKAGTGTVTFGNHSFDLTINYAHNGAISTWPRLPAPIQQNYWLPDIENGGMSFVYSENFFNNNAAVASFERALETWRCTSLVNFTVDRTKTSQVSSQNDDLPWESTVYFSTELSAGTIGRAYIKLDGAFLPGICPEESPLRYPSGIDIAFRMPSENITYYYGTDSPSSTEIDFETLAMHELGHAHGLGHRIDSGSLMHFKAARGHQQRSPNQHEMNGVLAKLEYSAQPMCVVAPEINGPMITLSQDACELPPCEPPAVVTGITATPSEGQVALTWNEVAGANVYRIYRSDFMACNQNPSFTLITTTTEPNYTDTNLLSGGLYTYQITSMGACESEPSDCIEAQLPGDPICNYFPSETSVDVDDSLGNYQVTVSMTSSLCEVTPVANDAWIEITGTSQEGTVLTVSYSVSKNLSFARTGTISFDSDTVTVNQARVRNPFEGVDPLQLAHAIDSNRRILTLDANGDSFPDLIHVNVWEPSSLFINNGDGTFAAGDPLFPLGTLYHGTVGDFNNDGLDDVAFPSFDGHNRVYLNTGTAPYFPTPMSTVDSVRKATAFGSGDVNNDGFLDLIEANWNNATNAFFLNDGAGDFSQATSNTLPGGSLNTWFVETADLNNDGFADVVVVNDKAASYIVKNTGASPYFTDANTVVLGNSSSGNLADQVQFVSIHDLDGNGFKDILVGRESNTQVMILYNQGNFQFTTEYVNTSLQVAKAYGGDFNNDNLQDLLVSGIDGLVLFINNGTENPYTGPELPLNNTMPTHSYWPAWGFHMVLTDLDLDGDLDIAGNGNDPIIYFLNDSVEPPVVDPSLTMVSLTTAPVSLPSTIEVALLSDDKRPVPRVADQLSIEVSREGSDDPAQSLTITDNQNGTYSASFTPELSDFYSVSVSFDGNPVPNSPFIFVPDFKPLVGVVASEATPGMSSLKIVDLNGDGLRDVAGSGHYALNNGSKTPFTEFLNFDNLTPVAFGNFNGDAFTDFIGNDSNLYLNTGSAPFFSTGSQVLSSSSGLEVADINGDQIDDLVQFNGSGLTIFTNDGTGVFTGGDTLALLTSDDARIFADMNGDNRPDLIVGTRTNGSPNTIFYNNGSRPYFSDGNKLEFSTDSAWGLRSGDFNGDGNADIAVLFQDLLETQKVTFYITGAANPSFVEVELLREVAVGDIDNDGNDDIVTLNFLTQGMVYFSNGTDTPFDAVVPNALYDVKTNSQVLLADFDHDDDLDAVLPSQSQVQYYENLMSLTSASQSTLQAPATGNVGESLTVLVQAKDEQGNNRSVGGDRVDIQSVDAQGSQTLTVTDNGDGTYTAAFVPRLIGEVRFNARMNLTLSGSASTQVLSPGSPLHYTLEMPAGITINQPTYIPMQAKNSNGDPIALGGAFIEVTPLGSGEASVVDHGDGTYSIIYTASSLDDPGFEVRVDDILLPGAPFQTPVLPEAFNVDQPADIVPITTANPRVIKGDFNGDGFIDIFVGPREIHLLGSVNPVDPGIESTGFVYVVDLNGDNYSDLLIREDCNDYGLYLNTQTAPYFGSTPDKNLNVAVGCTTVNFADINGDQFIDILTDSQAFINDGTTEFSAVSYTLDRNGFDSNMYADVNGDGHVDLIELGFTSNAFVHINTGTTPYFTGAGTEIPDSAGAVAHSGHFNGDGALDLYIANFTGNQRYFLNDGNGIFSEALIVGDQTLPANSFGFVHDMNNDGMDDLVMQNDTGVFFLYNNHSAEPLSGSVDPDKKIIGNFVINLTSPFDDYERDGDVDLALLDRDTSELKLFLNQTLSAYGPNSSFEIEPGVQAQVLVGTLTAKDRLGNARTIGGDLVTATVTGANTADMTIRDNNDGTYSLSYTPTALGEDQIQITVNGVDMDMQTVTIFSARPDLDASSATVPATGSQNQAMIITIYAESVLSEPMVGADVKVTIGGANTGLPAVADLGAGNYQVEYVPINGGTTTVEVTINGLAITGSPFTTEINLAPVAVDDFASTELNTSVDIPVLDNDSDPVATRSLSLNVNIARPPSSGSVEVLGSGAIRYSPTTGFEGIDSFTYQAIDDQGLLSNVATVIVTVSDTPLAEDDFGVSVDHQVVSINVLENDHEGSTTLTGELLSVTEPQHGELSWSFSGVVTYTPTDDYLGEDYFSYSVIYTQGQPAITANVTIDRQASPVANDDSSLVASQSSDLNLTAIFSNDTDLDGFVEPSSLTIIDTPTKGSISGLGSENPVYTVNGLETGEDSFTYQIVDADGNASNTATVTLFINGTQDDVLKAYNGKTSVENRLAVLDNDVFTDPTIRESIAIVESHGPSFGTVRVEAGHIIYTPDVDQFQADSFSYTISDGAGGRSRETRVDLELFIHIPSTVLKTCLLGTGDQNQDDELTPEEALLVDSISCQEISSSEGLAYFSNVTSISLDGNIRRLPDLSNFSQLTSLTARGALEELNGFPNTLSYLELGRNNLTSLPDLSGLTNLTFLNVYATLISELPELPLGLNVLQFTSSRLTSIPDLSGFNMQTVSLSHNPLTSLDANLLPNVRTLWLRNCGLTEMPNFSHLSNLRDFDLAYNELTTFDAAFLPSELTSNRSALRIDHNYLDNSVCATIEALAPLFASNNGLFEYRQQGNSGLLLDEIAALDTSEVTSFLSIIGQISGDEILPPLTCLD